MRSLVRPLPLLAAALTFLFHPHVGHAGIAQKVAAKPDPGISALAVYAQGRTHVSWQSLDHHLHYALIDGGKKSDQVVDAVGPDSGGFSSITVDSAGLPHIAYHAVREGVGDV